MEEPSSLVRWTMFFFAGGDAGIIGGLGMAFIAILSLLTSASGKLRSFLAAVATVLILMVCGSIPVPIWFQISTLVWLILVVGEWASRQFPTATEFRTTAASLRTGWRTSLLLISIVWLATAITLELPFHVWSKPANPVSDLFVIGDSVTAGLNDGEQTWPRLVSKDWNIHVVDASQPGATLQSARQQNSLFADQSGLVVIEIGGNDMLEGLPVVQFEEHLDRLLTEVCQSGRSVVLLELPLPPFHAEYGSAQRRQALRHQVALIPKRQFARILTTRGATVDGIHLSKNGQIQMKMLIESLLGNRLHSGEGTYERRERTWN